MTDTPPEVTELRRAWLGLGHRLAVAGGCLVALISLFHHVPVSTASLRGGALYFVIRVIAKAGLFAMERSIIPAPGAMQQGDTK